MPLSLIPAEMRVMLVEMLLLRVVSNIAGGPFGAMILATVDMQLPRLWRIYAFSDRKSVV